MSARRIAAAAGLILLVLLSGVPNFAAAFDTCSGRSEEPFVMLLSPPPCEACEKTKAELDELAQIAKDTPGERKARAAQDVEMSLAQFLRGAGISFDAGMLKGCEGALFFQMQRKDEKAVLDAAKDAFCRTRPFNTPGNTLSSISKGMAGGDNSYPSGHAAYGAAMGFLLAGMLPEKRAAIYSRIEDYAYSRLVLGVHFRSDVEAGKLMGAALAASLLSKPGVSSAFEETKTCVRKAAGLD